jgi:hypothetical protein
MTPLFWKLHVKKGACNINWKIETSKSYMFIYCIDVQYSEKKTKHSFPFIDLNAMIIGALPSML